MKDIFESAKVVQGSPREKEKERVNIERGGVVKGIKKFCYYFRKYNDFLSVIFSLLSLEVQLLIHLLR